MRFEKKVLAGLVVAWAGGAASIAAPPPLDRPTPPPCCADGICYPNDTWGVYPTRWRRWPSTGTSALEPTPAQPRPDELGPAVPPYVTPRPEEEDRRAPPPTRRPEGVEAEEEGDDAAPVLGPTGPSGPIGPGGPAGPGGPNGPPMGPPNGTAPSGSPGRLPGPIESSPAMPWDEPTSDADPPPAPPFAGMQSRPQEASRVRPAARVQGPALAKPASNGESDPPPPLPLAFLGG